MTDREHLAALAKAVRLFLAEEGYQGAADEKRLKAQLVLAEDQLAKQGATK